SNLTYTTVLNDTSAVNLAVSINDQGNTGSGGAQTSPVSNVSLNVAAVNDAPTLTTFAGAIDTVAEDNEVEITFADLAAQGNEADVDGTVDAFVIKAVSSGTLKIGTSAGTATLWAAGTNDTVDSTNNAYWIPVNHANGTLDAFTAVAMDNDGVKSTLPVQAQVTVTAVNDDPSVNAPASISVTEDVASAITGISFADVDAAGGSVVATFTVTQGTLGAGSGGGVVVSGAATNLTLTGSVTDINNFISASNLTYTTVLNDTSAVNLGVSINDGGNTGGAPKSSPVSNVTLNVTPVNDAPTGTVNIAGTAAEDQVLTASNLLSDADGMSAVSYHWHRDGVDIAGATASSYTLVDADVGAGISVVASYTDGDGTLENVTSAPVGPVANTNDAPAGLVNITGTPAEMQVLSADTGGVSDSDGLGTFSYQWLRNGVNIGGATASTYTLVSADVGADISVQVSYTDGHGTPESVNSAVVGPVAEAALPPIPPTTLDPDPPPATDPPVEDPATEPPVEDPVAEDPGPGSNESTAGPDAPPSGGVAAPLETLLGLPQQQNVVPLQPNEVNTTQSTSDTRIVAVPGGFNIRDFALEQVEIALDGVGFIVAPTTSLPSFGSGVQGIDAPEFVEELNRLRDDVEQQTRVAGALTTTNFVATAGLSVGYLFWLLRTEVLLGSFLSSLPAWRLVDPLPVLGRIADEADDDDDSLESLVERRNRAAQAADKKHMVTS
ncbi:MAG: hypothetical protein JSU95_01385, partial [Betaproteobacteria bacterium]